MNKRIILLFVIILFLIISVCFTGNKTELSKEGIAVNGGPEAGGFIYRPDGTIELGEGLVAHGFFDVSGKLVKEGNLYLPVDGVVKGTVNLQQNREETNYMLIVLIDYRQHTFLIDGNRYQNYPFTLSGNTEINIDIEVELEGKSARELVFMIVEEPENMKLSYENASASRNYYASRIQLNEEDVELNYSVQYREMPFVSNYMFELAKSHKSVKMLLNSKGGDWVELALGGQNEKDMKYAIIAFAGWKQCPIWKNEMLQYVSVPAGRNIYFSIQLPEVDEDTPYQIFGFENPYAIDSESKINTATLRTILKRD